jgi:hypothetical protein
MTGSTLLIAVLALVLGFAVWQLSQGPLRLAWLVPYLERALSPADGSFAKISDRTSSK